MADPRRETLLARVSEFLGQDDRVVLPCPAVWVEFAEVNGRGTGEGSIYLTLRSLLFWLPDSREPLIGFPLSGIAKVEHTWTAFPKMRHLTVTVSPPEGGKATFSFYCGKSFVVALVAVVDELQRAH